MAMSSEQTRSFSLNQLTYVIFDLCTSAKLSLFAALLYDLDFMASFEL